MLLDLATIPKAGGRVDRVYQAADFAGPNEDFAVIAPVSLGSHTPIAPATAAPLPPAAVAKSAPTPPEDPATVPPAATPVVTTRSRSGTRLAALTTAVRGATPPNPG